MPPEVDRSGLIPVLLKIISDKSLTSLPGLVRNESPECSNFKEKLFLKFSNLLLISSSIVSLLKLSLYLMLNFADAD